MSITRQHVADRLGNLGPGPRLNPDEAEHCGNVLVSIYGYLTPAAARVLAHHLWRLSGVTDMTAAEGLASIGQVMGIEPTPTGGALLGGEVLGGAYLGGSLRSWLKRVGKHIKHAVKRGAKHAANDARRIAGDAAAAARAHGMAALEEGKNPLEAARAAANAAHRVGMAETRKTAAAHLEHAREKLGALALRVAPQDPATMPHAAAAAAAADDDDDDDEPAAAEGGRRGRGRRPARRVTPRALSAFSALRR